MRNRWTGAIAGVAGMLFLSALAVAQNNAQNNAPRSPWKYYPMDRAIGDGGPAPKRDLTGTWAGPSSGSGAPAAEARSCAADDGPRQTVVRAKQADRQIQSRRHERSAYPVLRSVWFPQNMTQEIRGMTITTMPNRTFLLLQYMDLWREIWTDGRTLPTNVGGRGRDALDPKYNGYSIGRWEDDYTFVVETTGLAPETWATKSGYPHSVDAHVQERFHRDSKNDLTLTLTMD